jgi:hypothetical protein
LFAISFISALGIVKLHNNFDSHVQLQLQHVDNTHLPPTHHGNIRLGREQEQASLFGDKKSALPSWAVVTQCSIYHTDCPNHLEFEAYPFPLLPMPSKEDEQHIILSSTKTNEWIEEWKKQSDKKSDGDLVGYEYPAKVDDSNRKECIISTQTLSIEDQLAKVLKHLVPLEDTHKMIAFSMTDETYAKDMLHEVYEMNNDIVGFKGAFFFVAMDLYTANMACDFGYPVVAMPKNDDLKKQVQSTKVIISKLLVERGQSFLFYEMDVWFIRSPLPLLRQRMNDYDFLCSTHQWNPRELNIGFYAALANEGTINYFKDSLDIMEKNPLAHDQKIMHVVADDNTAILANRPVQDHNNCGWCGDMSVSFPAVKATNPIRVGLLDPHVVVSSLYPVPTEGTVALHTLADMPLKGPFGKQMVAKELGAWYGWGSSSKAGYYHREGAYRRYLFLENSGTRGGQSFVQPQGYHNIQAFRRQIAVLATLAKMTNRILILPQVLGDFHAQPLWIYLDLESLEKNGTVYREANFAYNKKSWYSHTKPFECVTQMAIVESSNETQLLTTADGIITTAFSDRIPLSTFAPDDPLTAVFAVASAHPDAKQSEALFVNLAHFQDGRGNLDEVHKLYSTLSWCQWGMGPSTKNNEVSATHLSSTDHCYGEGKAA